LGIFLPKYRLKLTYHSHLAPSPPPPLHL